MGNPTEKKSVGARLKQLFMRESPRETAATWVTICYLLFQVYRTFINPLPAMLLRPIHVASIGLLCLLYHPGVAGKSKLLKNANEVLNFIAYAACPYIIFYAVTEYERLNRRIAFLDPVQLNDKIVCVLLIFVILLGIWRTVGKVLTIFIGTFIAYVWIAPYLPGLLYYGGINFTKFVDLMSMGTAGIFGSASGASAGFMYWIMIFGRLFAFCGGGAVLIDIGMKAGSKAKDNSGPAKAAVLASGLMGMISGSAASNVAGTGVITIPLMKKVGYTPEDAGAIEAVASTGGQIMPPIMGTGAFLMAELMGVTYFTICGAAIIPAFTYYFGVFVLVTMMAKRVAAQTHHDKNVDWSKQKEEAEPIIPRLYLLFPVVALCAFIGMGFTLQRAALWAIGVIILINIISPRLRHGPLFFLEKLLQATKLSTSVSMPISGCGIIIGIVAISGLATKMSGVISSFAGDMMWVGLIITMLGCMVLGMALPTVAAYLTAYVLFIPTLTGMGISTLAANMFIFYFGIFAQITPPVCVASYTAAGIAEASSWKTGWKGMMFAACAFFAPFVFVYQPGVLLQGTVTEIVLASAILLFGTYAMSCGIGGYFFGTMDMWQRVYMGVAGCMVCIPESFTDYIGIGMVAVMILIQRARQEKGQALTVK